MKHSRLNYQDDTFKGTCNKFRFKLEKTLQCLFKNDTYWQEQYFLEAVANNKLSIVKLYIKNNVNINATNDNGFTALMIACSKGYYKIIDCLLQNNADVNIKSVDGYYPISFLIEKFDIDNYKIQKNFDTAFNVFKNSRIEVINQAISDYNQKEENEKK